MRKKNTRMRNALDWFYLCFYREHANEDWNRYRGMVKFLGWIVCFGQRWSEVAANNNSHHKFALARSHPTIWAAASTFAISISKICPLQFVRSHTLQKHCSLTHSLTHSGSQSLSCPHCFASLRFAVVKDIFAVAGFLRSCRSLLLLYHCCYFCSVSLSTTTTLCARWMRTCVRACLSNILSRFPSNSLFRIFHVKCVQCESLFGRLGKLTC